MIDTFTVNDTYHHSRLLGGEDNSIYRGEIGPVTFWAEAKLWPKTSRFFVGCSQGTVAVSGFVSAKVLIRFCSFLQPRKSQVFFSTGTQSYHMCVYMYLMYVYNIKIYTYISCRECIYIYVICIYYIYVYKIGIPCFAVCIPGWIPNPTGKGKI